MINLKIAAIHVGLRQKAIAETLGVPPNHVSRWLNHQTAVPDRHKLRLAELLHIRVEDLLPRSEIEAGQPETKEDSMTPPNG